jgi:hypothetical protein
MILKDSAISTIVTDKKTKFNGKSIEWIAVGHEKYQDGTVLFSKDILCCKPFGNLKKLTKLNELDCKECLYYEECSTYWKKSNIRNWLNTDKRKKEWRL